MTAKTAAAGPGPKQQLYLQFAEMAKALGHAHRLEILELLAQGERSVESLAERAGLSIGNASQHLRLMRQAGLLVSRRDGKRILYRLSDPAVLDLTAALHRLAERNLGEVKSVLAGYFNQRDSMEPVSRKELSRRLRDGLVTLLVTYPTRSTSHCATLRVVSASFQRSRKSSRTVEGRTACLRSKRWQCCEVAVLKRGDWKMDIRNGRRQVCPSKNSSR
jgi:DNA-binding transcriptional ArsR family regulator